MGFFQITAKPGKSETTQNRSIELRQKRARQGAV